MAEARSITDGPAIGIDLGTTYSCVAVVRNGKVEVITNDAGNPTTPSFVAFNEHERLIGEDAKDQIAANSVNTIFGVKRLIGRKFNDPIVQKDMQQWPFKVVDVSGMPKIEITYKGEVKRFSPEEISGMVLGKMRDIAESHLNATVKNAVVTVPAYFNDAQRKATKDAGTIAGLNVSRIINEPTAAAIAYGLANDTRTAKNVLVYDLGGGTFDVSILNICEGVYEVKATGGDTHLGGEDFDNIVMKALAAEFKRKHNVDITGNKAALRKLRTASERAKRTLSSRTHAPIQIDSLAGGIDFATQITRARFNEMCADLFGMTIKVVKCALKDAQLKSGDIDTVVLVGGSTRIPKIQQLLQELFVGKEVNKSINPDEAVAYGAAVQAAIIHGNAGKEMLELNLLEVTPLTLGIVATVDGERKMVPMIKRNKPIPTSQTKSFATLVDDQTTMSIEILQGEREMAKDNYEIGQLGIHGIPKTPAKLEKVLVTFSIDANGILNVAAVSESNPDAKGGIAVENVCGSLTKAEIEKMVADAASYREQDREAEQCRTARSELEEFCFDIKAKHGRVNGAVNEKCNEIMKWLKSCHRPKLTQFRKLRDELKALAEPPKDVKAVPLHLKTKTEVESGNESDESIEIM